ncbi:MAG: transporter [Rhodospirillales bacterium]|nr:transporter [Rhodospirillales bacterium]
MGAITPIASGLSAAVGTLNTLGQVVGAVQTLSGNSNSRQEQDLALRQLQERQRLEQARLAQSNALEREKIATQTAQDEEDRRAALRRAVARQRASFGGQGISASGGSAQAVLLGLFDETEDEINRRTELDSLRTRALDLGESQNRSLNLLQATQLQQRQKLNNELTLFDRLF